MIVGRVDIADIMQKGRHHPIDIRPALPRSCRGLKGVAKPRDLVAGQRLVEVDHGCKQSVSRACCILNLMLGQESVVLAVAILHLRELYRLHRLSLMYRL